MKLSEAIREGAKLRPQNTFGGYFFNDCSCAMGAVYEAGTGLTAPTSDGSQVTLYLEENFPELFEVALHPLTNREVLTRFGVVMDLNDRQKWTRNQIADWLEQQGF